MNIVITGANGFIGRHAVAALRPDHTILAVGRSEKKLKPLTSVDSVNGLSCEYGVEALRDGFEGMDVVLHLAAERSGFDRDRLQDAVVDTNVRLTQNVLQAAVEAGLDHVCLASSISVYGASDDVPFVEDQRPEPPHAYALSKVVSEHVGEMMMRNLNLDVTSLRIGSVYGYEEATSDVLMKFVRSAARDQELVVWGEGKRAMDFVYVEDVVSAMKSVIERRVPGIFNVGADTDCTIKEVAKTVNRVFDNHGNLSYDKEKEEAHDYWMDCSRAKDRLGWTPSYTLEEGLQEVRKQMGSVGS